MVKKSVWKWLPLIRPHLVLTSPDLLNLQWLIRLGNLKILCSLVLYCTKLQAGQLGQISPWRSIFFLPSFCWALSPLLLTFFRSCLRNPFSTLQAIRSSGEHGQMGRPISPKYSNLALLQNKLALFSKKMPLTKLRSPCQIRGSVAWWLVVPPDSHICSKVISVI